MTLLEEIKITIDVLKQKRKFKTQKDVAIYLGYNPSYFSRLMGGKEDVPIDFENKFFTAFPKSVYLYGKDDMFSDHTEPPPPTDKKTDALDQLKKIQNGKNKNSNECKVFGVGNVVKIKTYIIPMKGFSGLKRAIYNDQYITEKFEETTTEVPHHLYSPVSYRIQSSGESMPKSIPNNAWVTGVPVSEDIWYDYKFDTERVYILFHPYRGILFKRVERLSEKSIKLMSENEDKIEYPDEIFEITEFRKILLAIKVETFI